MATGYVRQSSAEIVNGQVIEDTDFNNEFDRIQSFASGSTGHDHSGGTGLGPPINLTATTPGVSGILDAQFGGVHTAAADPTSSNCTPSYVRGCIWVNTSTNVSFICLDNTNLAAVWERLPPGTTSGAAVLPAVTDDAAHGFRTGSIMVNTTQAIAYVCVDNTTGAAVWIPVGKGRVFAAASDPGATDDNTKGYAIGSVAVNTSSSTASIATSVGTGTATWTTITTNSGYVALIAQVFAS